MAGSWWLYRSVAGQSMAPWSIYQSTPALLPADDSSTEHFRELYPDRAPGPQRAAYAAYQGLLSSIAIADSVRPPGVTVAPSVAPGPLRSAVSAYGGIVSQQIADGVQPPGSPVVASPVFPDRTNAVPRTSNSAYQTWTSQVAFGLPLNAPAQGVQSYPPTAPGPFRAGNHAYHVGLRPPYGDPESPGSPVFPDRAPAASRASQSAYVALVGIPINVTPPGPPMGPQANYPFMSLPARIPLRATSDAYRGLLSSPCQADRSQPAGSPEFPSLAATAQRASSVAYVGLLSRSAPGDRSQPARPSWPDFASPASRAVLTAYQVVVAPEIGDKVTLVNRQYFPDRAPGPQRAAISAYYSQPQSMLPMPPAPVSVNPFFPDAARIPVRVSSESYRGLLSKPVIGDRNQPASPYWPDRSPPSSRSIASTYFVSLQAAPTDTNATPGHPNWPDFARISARSSTSSYVGLLSRPVTADGSQPSGKTTISSPRLDPQRSVSSSYAGLLSSQPVSDRIQPPGILVYPIAALSPPRAPGAAYTQNVKPSPPSVRPLSVSVGLRLVPMCALGQFYTINVSANLNLQPVIIQGPAGGLDARYRSGDQIPISFAPPFTPTHGTTLTVSAVGGSTIETTPLWTWDGVNWQTSVLVGSQFTTGDYNAKWVATNAIGTTSIQWVQFSVVAGGDPGSSVIAIYAQDSPDGRVILAQLRSGVLVRGQGPWV